MQPDRAEQWRVSSASIERLADDLFGLAGDQEVRVVEALAAVLARHGPTTSQDDVGERYGGLSEAPNPFAQAASDADTIPRRAICRRIARRALHGSLVDPTRGATAVHRVDESPDWARDLLPTAMFGRFLFYCPSRPRWWANDGSMLGGCVGSPFSDAECLAAAIEDAQAPT